MNVAISSITPLVGCGARLVDIRTLCAVHTLAFVIGERNEFESKYQLLAIIAKVPVV